jgi:hypothetical protein
MQYFIILPGDKEKDSLSESNLLGEESFGTFWTGSGMKVLRTIISQKPELVEAIIIKTEQNKVLSVDDFLSKVNKLKIRS